MLAHALRDYPFLLGSDWAHWDLEGAEYLAELVPTAQS